jgi:hypothetical protein
MQTGSSVMGMLPSFEEMMTFIYPSGLDSELRWMSREGKALPKGEKTEVCVQVRANIDDARRDSPH